MMPGATAFQGGQTPPTFFAAIPSLFLFRSLPFHSLPSFSYPFLPFSVKKWQPNPDRRPGRIVSFTSGVRTEPKSQKHFGIILRWGNVSGSNHTHAELCRRTLAMIETKMAYHLECDLYQKLTNSFVAFCKDCLLSILQRSITCFGISYKINYAHRQLREHKQGGGW